MVKHYTDNMVRYIIRRAWRRDTHVEVVSVADLLAGGEGLVARATVDDIVSSAGGVGHLSKLLSRCDRSV